MLIGQTILIKHRIIKVIPLISVIKMILLTDLLDWFQSNGPFNPYRTWNQEYGRLQKQSNSMSNVYYPGSNMSGQVRLSQHILICIVHLFSYDSLIRVLTEVMAARIRSTQRLIQDKTLRIDT